MLWLEKILGAYLYVLMLFFEVMPAWLDELRRRREEKEERIREKTRKNQLVPEHDRHVVISFRGSRR